MRVTKITASNFKGRDFAYVLSPVTVIAGGNFSGKTAVLDAIRVGLMGYLPTLGKQPSSTWKLAGSKKQMTVNLATDSTELSHVWRGKKDGGASYEGTTPWETPVVLLDTKQYFTQTAADRLNMVFAMCDPARLGYKDSALIERLSVIEVLPTRISRPIVEKLVEQAGQALADRGTKAVQVWLAEYIADLKMQQKAAQNAAKFASGQVSGLKAGPMVGGFPKDVSTDLSAATSERDKLAGRVQAMEDARKQSGSATERIAEIEEQLAELPADLQTGIKSLKTDLEAIPSDSASDRMQEVITLREQATRLEAEMKKNETALVVHKATDPDLYDACPHCGSNHAGWSKALKAKFAEGRDELLREQAGLRAQIEPANQQLVAAREAFQQACKVDAKLANDRAAIQNQITLVELKAVTKSKLEAELNGLRMGGMVDTAELPIAREQLHKANERVSELQQQQNAFTVFNNEQTKREGAEDALIKSTAEVDVLKAAVKTVTEMQADMVEVAFNELLRKARLFTDGILKSPLVYYDGDLGRLDGDKFVSWETFSGTEEAIAFAGLSVALAQSAPIKVVLMDELGRLTAANKALLAQRMAKLVRDGVIDNFVGVDVDASAYGESATIISI